MSRLSNKVALVTGASNGIGAGIAMAWELRARAREIIRAALIKRLLAITNPFGSSAQGSARCTYSCARAVASAEPAESQRAVPPVPDRHSGQPFRRSNGTPTLHHKSQDPIRPH